MAASCPLFVPNFFNKKKCRKCFGTRDKHSAEALNEGKAAMGCPLESVSSKNKHEFTPAKIQELHDTFCMFDKNRDGLITPEELVNFLASLGQRPQLREARALIRSVDRDNSGAVDFDEFLQIFHRKMAVDPEKELYEVFCVFDKNKDGGISPNELFEVISKLGESLTQEEAIEMVKEADMNGDGKVDYIEFKSILNSR